MCVGDGSTSSKELIGDALRNGAMRFGIALDLWTGIPPDHEVRSAEELAAENAKLRSLVELQAERIAQLEKLIEEVRRGGKRQAAPFSKGIRNPNPKKPGRKGGEDYGTKARRRLPEREPDRVLPVPLPDSCAHCSCEDLIALRTA